MKSLSLSIQMKATSVVFVMLYSDPVDEILKYDHDSKRTDFSLS